MPKEFILQAEESGLIVLIGEWVLRAACMQNKIWQEKGLMPIRVAVNVSNQQIRQENFIESVVNILKETKLEAKYLELELTENVIIYHEDIIQTICTVKDHGIQIALDDFGTGYSSISYLRKVPIDRIKIDRTYIQNMHKNSDDAAIVRAIIALSVSLNLQVLAEGVETLKQFQILSSQKCKEAQGFYFSEPLPSEEMEKFLLFYQNKQFA